MGILIDESLPGRLASHLLGADVSTVQRMGWASKSNGELLALAAAEGFDAFLTADKGIQHQQNVPRLALSIVILRSYRTRFRDLVPLMPEVIARLEAAKEP